MAEPPKKPKKIKDLKARLGKTISPNTPGAGGAVPPPNLGGKPAAGAVPPPTGVTPPPGATPPAVAAPPFGQPAATPSAPPADPFAAAQPAAAAGPQEVRLVIDDKTAVDDAEIGRQNRSKNFILIALGLIVGGLVGSLLGTTIGQNQLEGQSIQHGKEIYDSVRESSNTISEAQRLVDQAVTAARGGPGKPAAVDYEALEALRGLEKPFQANDFARKNYSVFDVHIVDSLFTYYNDVQRAWTQIERIENLTTGESRRAELNAATEAMEGMAEPTGCVPTIANDRIMCNLAYVRVDEEKLMVRGSRRARREIEKEVYTGQDLTESASDYVILVNTPQSTGVLGEQASLFAEYVRDVGALKALLDGIVETQGRLEQQLGPIASRASE